MSKLLLLCAVTLIALPAEAGTRRSRTLTMGPAAAPVLAPQPMPGVSASDHALYLRNLRDSGYDKRKDFNAVGNMIAE